MSIHGWNISPASHNRARAPFSGETRLSSVARRPTVAGVLPVVETDEEWDAVVPDETVMRAGPEDFCARLRLAGAPLSRFPEGSQPVYAMGDELVLKLFPAAAAQDGVAEGRVLPHLHGLLPVPTPQVHEFGPYENGRQHVLMSRLPGENLAHAWDRMTRADHERLVADVGEALAVLHSLGPAPLADVLGPGGWGAFLDGRRAAAVEQQKGHGLPPAWLDQIPDFLTSVALPLAYTLLHVYSNLPWYLREPDAPAEGTLTALAAAWVGTA